MTDNKIDQELLDCLFIQLILTDHAVIQVDLVINGMGNDTTDLKMFFRIKKALFRATFITRIVCLLSLTLSLFDDFL